MRVPASLMAIALLPALVAACSSGNNQGPGTIVGAVTGGLVGNQLGRGKGKVAATAAGAVIGGIIGNQIGRDMDEQDRRMAAAAEYRALEYGQSDAPTPGTTPGPATAARSCPASIIRKAANSAVPTPTPSISAGNPRP